jgi:GNAT superfamily N-acetyltransferase
MSEDASRKVVSIRRATAADAQRISALAREVALKYIVHAFTPEGRVRFLKETEPEATAKRLAASDKYRYLAAEDGEAIVAVAALQGAGHVHQLFVAPGYERGGLGRRLWELLRAEALGAGKPRKFTVNAPHYAIAAYARLGFERDGEMRDDRGIVYQPMSMAVKRAKVPAAAG